MSWKQWAEQRPIRLSMGEYPISYVIELQRDPRTVESSYEGRKTTKLELWGREVIQKYPCILSTADARLCRALAAVLPEHCDGIVVHLARKSRSVPWKVWTDAGQESIDEHIEGTQRADPAPIPVSDDVMASAAATMTALEHGHRAKDCKHRGTCRMVARNGPLACRGCSQYRPPEAV